MSKDVSRRKFLEKIAIGGAAGASLPLWTNLAGAKARLPQRTLGHTGAKVSILAFGCGSRFLMYKDDDEAVKVLNHALDLGITYVDTAYLYGDGKSETRVGKVMATRRKEVWLATKIPDRTRDGFMSRLEGSLIEGLVVVPRFVLRELQQIADSGDAIKRARGRRGLEMLNRIQRNTNVEVRIHDGDFPEEKEVDAKLVRLARNLNARLYTNDYNLAKVAQLQKVNYVNLHEVAKCLKVVLLPGETLHLKIVREGKDKGQGIGYLPDGTMVVVNNAQPLIGQHIEAQVQTLLQTGAGVIVFAEVRPGSVPTPDTAFVHK